MLLPTQRNPMPVTWERSFFAALRALRHLYFQLDNAGLELHSQGECVTRSETFLLCPTIVRIK